MMISLIVFLFGLAFGSFLNVCIHRLPKGESIVKPRSRCPHCGKPVAAWDNIPLLSYLVLRGRCRNCQKSISPLYPFVELLTGLLLLWTYRQFGFTAEFIKFSVFGMLLLILIFTDLQERIIPHAVTIFGIFLGTSISWLVPVERAASTWLLHRMGFFPPTWEAESFLASVAGMILGGGSFYLVGTVFYYLKGKQKDYLGFGDVMLMAMVGSFLGMSLTLLTIFLGSLLGALIGVPLEYTTKRFHGYEWPFVTFLGVAALFSSFGGKAVINWYLRVSGLN